ncbi:pseudouridylate synthase 1 homolog [Centruroides vittatus]|uniref:pseudouridylate synthase 1 homolog n=1 Tax=Centruroides vittatus TaxID=120091 RepID=UPI0035105CB8
MKTWMSNMMREKRSLPDNCENSPAKKFKSENEEQISNNDEKSEEKDLILLLKGKPKKMAMMISYCGKGYFGMQRNHGVKTIEEDILIAMYKARLIAHDRYEKPQLMHFQRAARTDKGVSAACQIISLKLPPIENFLSVIELINNNLPPQIRVMGLKRATKNFNAKLSCDARIYSYILPTFAFSNPTEDIGKTYRIPENRLQEVNRICRLFHGTHNFHNFTAGRKATDASAKRYIMSFECGEPFVQDEIEFVTLKIKGQSFMLHQIRKMIGLVIAIIRNVTDASCLQRCWSNSRIDIPIAPSIGLMLEEVCYEKYNKKYGNDGIHQPLLWKDCEKAVNEFKEKFIYPSIVEAERNENSMLNWMSMLKDHTYDVREPSPPNENLSKDGNSNTQE